MTIIFIVAYIFVGIIAVGIGLKYFPDDVGWGLGEIPPIFLSILWPFFSLVGLLFAVNKAFEVSAKKIFCIEDEPSTQD